MVAQVSLLQDGDRQLIDRYQLVGEIASGGMASVFLARLAGVGGFQRLVAIKRLHPHLAAEPEFVQMFMDEARLAASIHHKNVVPILEIGNSDDGYYVVMEYIEGATVGKLMARAAATKEPIERSVLLRIVVDTLMGLHAAHELTGDDGALLDVVHRDVSPANILVGLDGCTRLTDFGIARATSRLANTREGALKGKLSYMAPEQTEGDEFDRRADIFSLGVVMWEVLAGRRLFRAKTEAATLKRLLHEPVPPLSKYRPDIAPALAAVCAKALERDPRDRYGTAAEMVDAIEAYARASGDPDTIAGERAVSLAMRERYGQDMDKQRESLRSWLAATPTLLDRNRGPAPSWSGEPSGLGLVAARPDDEVTGGGAAVGAPGAGASGAAASGVGVSGGADESTDGGQLHSHTPPSVATDVLEQRPSKRGLWIAAALALVLGLVAVVVLNGGDSESKGDIAAAAPGEGADAPSTAAVSATVASAPAAAASADAPAASSSPSAQVSAQPDAADSVASKAPVPASRPAVRPRPRNPAPRPAPAPKPAGGDLDDLSNPYR